MGSKFSKAVRWRVKAAASSAAVAIHREADKAKENVTCQDPAPQLPNIFSHDDINTATSTAAPASAQRRNSEPARPAAGTVTMEQQSEARAAAFSLFLAENRMLSIQYADTDPTPPPPPPAVPFTPPPPPEPEVRCLICCEHLPKEKDPRYDELVVKPCGCSSVYCTSCIKDMFIQACKNTSRMPPRCCTQIHLHHARPYLTKDEIALFKSKYEEWSTPNPFYCPVPTCSVFIPERLLPQQVKSKGKRVDSGVGTPTEKTFVCPTCKTDICVECRQPAHPKSICNVAEFGLDAETAELFKSWGYKQCPKCRHGLKRMYGCNHMECRCGAHFCWVCLRNRDECDGACYDSEEDDGSYEEPDGPEESDSTSDTTENSDVTPTSAVPDNQTNQTTEGIQASLNAITVPETPTAPNTTATPPQPIPRPRNLDGGSQRYWEDQDLNFGEEPTDDIQDRSWNCHHSFQPYTLSLRSALTKDPSTMEMECVKCWCTVHAHIEASRKAHERTVTTVRGGGFIRGLGRGRGRGRGRYMPPRGLVRANATVGSTPLSQSVPTYEVSPMEDVQLSERVVDTYGNIITTTEPEQLRRASLDLPSRDSGEPSGKRPLDGFPFTFNAPSDAPAPPKLNFAHECQYCGLLVCEACKDAAVAAQSTGSD